MEHWIVFVSILIFYIVHLISHYYIQRDLFQNRNSNVILFLSFQKYFKKVLSFCFLVIVTWKRMTRWTLKSIPPLSWVWFDEEQEKVSRRLIALCRCTRMNFFKKSEKIISQASMKVWARCVRFFANFFFGKLFFVGGIYVFLRKVKNI